MTCDPFPLLPTPTAHDDGKSPEAHMAMKRTITSLAVLARAGFEQPASSPASADSTLPANGSSGPKPSGSANPTLPVEPSSSVTGPEFRACPTCGRSAPNSDPSTCCTAAIRVSRSRRQGNGEEPTTRVICGPSSPDAFAFYDPESSCLRTCQDTLLSGSGPSSVTLPPSGSMRNGWLYARPTWVPRIGGRDCSALLGTPTASDAKGASPNHGGTLAEHLALLPTPGANDMTGGEGATREARQADRTGGPALRDIGHLLPTPTVGDSASAANKTAGRANPDSKHHDGTTLTDAMRLLPTHRVSATRSSRRSMVEHQQWSAPSLAQALEISQGILPRAFQSWDEVPGWSGEPTSPPYAVGNTSSDDPPHGQLTIEDA